MTEKVRCCKCNSPKFPRQLRELPDGSKVCAPCRTQRAVEIVRRVARRTLRAELEPRATVDTKAPVVCPIAARFCSMKFTTETNRP